MVCSQAIKNELLSIFPSSLHTIIKFIVCEYYSEFLGEEIDQIDTRKVMFDNKQNYIYSYDQNKNMMNIYTVKNAKFSFLYSYPIIIPNLVTRTKNITTSLFIGEIDHEKKEYYLFDKHFGKIVATIPSEDTLLRLVGLNEVTYIIVVKAENQHKTTFCYQTYEQTEQFGEIQFVETLQDVCHVFILEEYGCVVTDFDDNVYTYKINSKTKQLEMIKQTCQKGYYVHDVKFGYVMLSQKGVDLYCLILNAETHDVSVSVKVNINEKPEFNAQTWGSFADQSTNYLVFYINEISYLFNTSTKNVTEIGPPSDLGDMMFLQNGDLLCFSGDQKIKKPSGIEQSLLVMNIPFYRGSLMLHDFLVYEQHGKLHLVQ